MLPEASHSSPNFQPGSAAYFCSSMSLPTYTSKEQTMLPVVNMFVHFERRSSNPKWPNDANLVFCKKRPVTHVGQKLRIRVFCSAPRPIRLGVPGFSASGLSVLQVPLVRRRYPLQCVHENEAVVDCGTVPANDRLAMDRRGVDASYHESSAYRNQGYCFIV